MSKKAETAFKEVFLNDLRSVPNIWAEKIQQVAKRGTPDILLCAGGHFVGIELKKSQREKPDVLQQHKLKKIVEAGGVAYVAYPENKDVVLGMIAILARRKK